MSAMLGLRKESKSSAPAWTASAAMVASDSASCATRRSGPRRLISRPPIASPRATPALENSRAAVPAARLVIQKRWCSAMAVIVGAELQRRLDGAWEKPERRFSGFSEAALAAVQASAPMVDAISAIALPRAESRLRLRLRAAVARPELLGLLLVTGVLELWALGRNGWANEYYSAAVRSMSSNWHAFLYGSFDAGGVMTVDKPPLALWVQALSVRVFGFSSWSMLVPQALMGVATVGLVYDLTRRHFGRVAGFRAGLALLLPPIPVAIARHNHPDALLVLCGTAAVWCVVRALTDGRTRWIVLAGVAVGL